MIKISVSQLAEIVGGAVVVNPEAIILGSVETDSRLVGPGSLFFAKPGDETDGHLFVSDALERGAIAAVEREMEEWLWAEVRRRGFERVDGRRWHFDGRGRWMGVGWRGAGR